MEIKEFNSRVNEILNEGLALKINLMDNKQFDRADGLISIKAMNDMAAGVRVIAEDLKKEGYERDDIKSYLYTLLQKMIKDIK